MLLILPVCNNNTPGRTCKPCRAPVSICIPLFCVCVYNSSQNRRSSNLKPKRISVFENSSEECDIGHFNQSQGHGLIFFSIYHNTSCQVPHLGFGTC